MGKDVAVVAVEPVELKFSVPTFTKNVKVGQPRSRAMRKRERAAGKARPAVTLPHSSQKTA